jgi:hypothetical protein
LHILVKQLTQRTTKEYEKCKREKSNNIGSKSIKITANFSTKPQKQEEHRVRYFEH